MGYLLLAIDQAGQTGIYLSSDSLISRYLDMGWTVWKIYPDGRREQIYG